MPETKPYQQTRKKRERFYKNELFRSEIQSGFRRLPAYVVDLNQTGVGLFLESASLDELSIGSPVSIILWLNKETKVEQTGTVVNIREGRYSSKNGIRLGVLFTEPNSTPKNSPSIRGQRIKIPDFFKPIGFCESPFKLGEIIHFQIADVSSTGLLLITSARNRTLIQGLPLRITLFLPGTGVQNLNVKITRVKVHSERSDRIEVGCKFTESNSSFLEAWVQSLLISGADISISALQSAGFPIGLTSKSYEFSYPSDRDDLKKIMELRLYAQHHQNRFMDVTDPWKMEDQYDAYSRQLLVRFNGKLIAATRLVFNDGQASRCEHSAMGAKIPDWLWKEGFVECSRAVTHPDYRGSDLYVTVTRHMARVILQSGHKYMLQSCEEKLLKFYKRSGCWEIGHFYCDDMPNVKWYLLVINMEDVIKASSIDPLTWNFVLAPLTDFLEARGLISLGIIKKTQLTVYKSLMNTAATLYKLKKRKKSAR